MAIAKCKKRRASARRTLRHTLPKAACHCDPMVENCIDDGQKIFIIDFEYAGNNDPMWDLGDLSVEGNFSIEQEHIFFRPTLGMSRVRSILVEW